METADAREGLGDRGARSRALVRLARWGSDLAGGVPGPYPRRVHTRPLRLSAAPFLSLLLAGAAAAETPAPLTIPDLTGPRTLALGAGVGVASGSEALFSNPAALAARKRYVVDTFYLTDRRPDLDGSAARQDYLGGTAADSATTAAAAGFSYARAMKGIQKGTLLRLGLATQLTRGLSVGVQGNYFDLHGAERVKPTLNLDAGVFLQVSPKVSIGGAGYNLLDNEHRGVLPRAWAAGFAVGADTSLQIVGEYRLELDRARAADGSAKSTNRYAIGAEYLFANAVPVRAGFERDETLDTSWWSAGAGYVTQRFAVDLGFRQSTTEPTARTYAVAIRVFVPQE